jgi:2-polyprenyl-3-methyl-5-hydroxy-6-metoxy-1,4-benzoquinol methylase
LCGWHSGARVYRVRALQKILFDLNAIDETFDTEILLQLLYAGATVRDFRGGSTRATRSCFFKNDLKAALKYRLQRYHLFYDVRYHPEELDPSRTEAMMHDVYNQKFSSRSPHSIVIDDERLVAPGSSVLDIGCAAGYLGAELTTGKSCRVTGIDRLPAERIDKALVAYHNVDLERDPERVARILSEGNFDAVLLLDVVEHLSSPEFFLRSLARASSARRPAFVLSTGNVAFIVVRLMLLMGHFNYGQKGILDITHKRLFSYHTFRNLLQQTGFEIREERYCPVPFRELGFPPLVAGFLESVNMFLIYLRPRLFAYQVMFSARATS